MIETYDNIFQVAILLLCVGASLAQAVSTREKSWVLLTFFYGSWTLGDLYWLAHLVFFGDTPDPSYVSDISWYAAYIFLYLLLVEVIPVEDAPNRHVLLWLCPVFTLAMALYYMQFGQYLSNSLTALLMGMLLFCSVRRLLQPLVDRQGRRILAWAVLVFCAVEYATWTISCFADDNIFDTLYLVGELMLALYMPFLLWTVGKAVKA